MKINKDNEGDIKSEDAEKKFKISFEGEFEIFAKSAKLAKKKGIDVLEADYRDIDGEITGIEVSEVEDYDEDGEENEDGEEDEDEE